MIERSSRESGGRKAAGLYVAAGLQTGLLTRFGNTDRLERPPRRRRGQPLRGEELPQQRARLGMRNRRLYADAHQAVGVIHRLPGVHGELAPAIVGVAVVAP